MQIIKQKINFLGGDSSIKIKLQSSADVFDNESEINNLIDTESEKSINEIDDFETIRFIYGPDHDESTPLFWYFGLLYFFDGDEYSTSFLNAGFTEDEILNYKPNLRHSFFIFDFFDVIEPYKQNKITTNYLTKFNVYNNQLVVNAFLVDFKNMYQIRYLNIPRWILDQYDENTITLYMSVMFYNAKGHIGNQGPSSKISVFYNTRYHDGTKFTENGDVRKFFKIKLNKERKVWYVDEVFPDNMSFIANEFITSGNKYKNKVSESIDTKDNIKQKYPEKIYFDEEERDYVME